MEKPMIEVRRSDHAWATLDGGCNSSCHGGNQFIDYLWKIAQADLIGIWVPQKEKSYGGLIGDDIAKMHGKRLYPLCVEHGWNYQLACFTSNELNTDTDLLLGEDGLKFLVWFVTTALAK